MIDVSQNLYVNGKGFVFDYYAGLTYTLNPAGVSILRELVEGAPVAKITRSLENQYGISHKTATGDIDDFLQQLSTLNLISHNGEQQNDSV